MQANSTGFEERAAESLVLAEWPKCDRQRALTQDCRLTAISAQQTLATEPRMAATGRQLPSPTPDKSSLSPALPMSAPARGGTFTIARSADGDAGCVFCNASSHD